MTRLLSSLATFGTLLIFICQTDVSVAAEDAFMSAMAGAIRHRDINLVVAPDSRRSQKLGATLSAAAQGLDQTHSQLIENSNSKTAEEGTMRMKQRRNEKKISELDSQIGEMQSDLENTTTVSRVAELMSEMTFSHNNLKADELRPIVNALRKWNDVQRLELRSGRGSHRVMTLENYTPHVVHQNMRQHHLRPLFREIDELFQAQFAMSAAEFLEAKDDKLRDIADARGDERELELQRREIQKQWSEIRDGLAFAQRELRNEMAENQRQLTEVSGEYIRLWERHHFDFEMPAYQAYLCGLDAVSTELEFPRRMNGIVQKHIRLKRQRAAAHGRYRVLNCTDPKELIECVRISESILQMTRELNVVLDECISLMPRLMSRLWPFVDGRGKEFVFERFDKPDTVHMRDISTGRTAQATNAMQDVVAVHSADILRSREMIAESCQAPVVGCTSLAEARVFIKLKTREQSRRFSQFNLHAKEWIMRDIRSSHSLVSEWWQSRGVLRGDRVLSKWPAKTAVYWLFFEAMNEVIVLMAAMYAHNVPITLGDAMHIQVIAREWYAQKVEERVAASPSNSPQKRKNTKGQDGRSQPLQKLEKKLGQRAASLQSTFELALLDISEVIAECLASDFRGKREEGRGRMLNFLDSKVEVARSERGTVVDIEITDVERDFAKRWVFMRETFALFQALDLNLATEREMKGMNRSVTGK